MSFNIADVAQKSGVCITTVSRVLNNHGKVREGNRQKVLAAIKEMGYNPNAAARALSKGRTYTIGVIVRTLNDSYWADLVEKIEQAALDKGYLLVLAVVNDHDYNMEKRWVKIFSEGRTDGILLISPMKEAEYLMDLRSSNFPVVLLDNSESEIRMPSIAVDDVKGGYLAVKHLIDNGHKRIGHIVGLLKYQAPKDRLEGYKLALTDAGIRISENLIGYSEYDFDNTYRITCEWLSRNERPTAIFAFDDIMAMAVMNAARSLNLSISKDLSIIGYDDGPICSWIVPKLTSVRQPVKQIAEEAVDMLVKYIENKPPRSKTIYVQPELIVRDSVSKA